MWIFFLVFDGSAILLFRNILFCLFFSFQLFKRKKKYLKWRRRKEKDSLQPAAEMLNVDLAFSVANCQVIQVMSVE
jgi:hypothetical protein